MEKINSIDVDEMEVVHDIENEFGIKLDIFYEDEFGSWDNYIDFVNNKKVNPHILITEKHVTALNLVGCNLKEIPQQVLKFQQLKELNLWNNDIEEIAKFLTLAQNLENLYLGRNYVRLIPEWIEEIPKLKYLELCYDTFNENKKFENIYKIGNISLNIT